MLMLQEDRDRATHRIGVAGRAKDQLIRTCNDPIVLRQQAELNQRLKPIASHINRLRDLELSIGLREAQYEERSRLLTELDEIKATLVELDNQKLIP